MIDTNYRHLGSCVFLAAAMAMASPSLAADMHDGASMKDMVEPEEMGGLWNGFYMGVHAGFGSGSFNATEVDPFFAALIDEELDHDPAGGVFGIQLGYNWQRSRWVFGIEGDVALSTVEGDLTYDFDIPAVGTLTSTESVELKYLTTLRARIGVDVGSVLVYATGGLALGKVDASFSTTLGGAGLTPDLTASGSDSATHVGYAVGGGIEAWLRKDISVRAEYLYADLGEETFQPISGVDGVAGEPFDLDMHLVRFGLNYHF